MWIEFLACTRFQRHRVRCFDDAAIAATRGSFSQLISFPWFWAVEGEGLVLRAFGAVRASREGFLRFAPAPASPPS